VLAGRAAEKTVRLTFISLAYLKLRVSEEFRVAKDEWHKDPDHHGSEEILLLHPPKQHLMPFPEPPQP
jgi:hypothetical protein